MHKPLPLDKVPDSESIRSRLQAIARERLLLKSLLRVALAKERNQPGVAQPAESGVVRAS